MKLVTTRGAVEDELGVIDTGEVEGTSGLHLAHGETERPRVRGEVVEDVIGKVGTVHFRDDIVVIHIGSVLEECHTVNVKGRCREIELVGPVITRSLSGNDVKRLHGVVEIAQVDIGIGIGRQLVLGLCNKKFVIVIGEKLTLFCVKVDVVAVHLGGVSGDVSIAALDADLDIVVLKRHEGEYLRPVLAEEEGNHVVITGVVFLSGVGRGSHRRLRGRVT